MKRAMISAPAACLLLVVLILGCGKDETPEFETYAPPGTAKMGNALLDKKGGGSVVGPVHAKAPPRQGQ
jgi:hypothetical protein